MSEIDTNTLNVIRLKNALAGMIEHARTANDALKHNRPLAQMIQAQPRDDLDLILGVKAEKCLHVANEHLLDAIIQMIEAQRYMDTLLQGEDANV